MRQTTSEWIFYGFETPFAVVAVHHCEEYSGRCRAVFGKVVTSDFFVRVVVYQTYISVTYYTEILTGFFAFVDGGKDVKALYLWVYFIEVHDNGLIVTFSIASAVVTGVDDRAVKAGGIVKEDEGCIVKKDPVIFVGDHDGCVKVIGFTREG